MEAEIA